MLTPFVNKADYLRDLTAFMIWFISSFEIISVVIRGAKSEVQTDPNVFLWITVSVADTAAVNPNSIKTIS